MSRISPFFVPVVSILENAFLSLRPSANMMSDFYYIRFLIVSSPWEPQVTLYSFMQALPKRRD